MSSATLTPEAQFMDAARQAGDWIPAQEILPPHLTEVLASDGDYSFLAFVDFEGRWFLGARLPAPDNFVTHWRPKPLLPDGRVEE